MSFAALLGGGGSASAQSGVFRAHATGAQEVPPVETRAQAQIVLRLSADGTELNYRLVVANIEQVTASHLHLAHAGANGPVVAFLFPGPTTPGRTNGVLAEGTITSASLIGPLTGQTLADLIQAMKEGRVYVNVHTLNHSSGEVRGQVTAHP